jgi:hypothetical protein
MKSQSRQHQPTALSDYLPADGGPIDSSQVSVVIQGPLFQGVKGRSGIRTCLEAIRHVLPDAETIVATWQNEDTSEVRADNVEKLDDPGGFADIGGNIINIARQDLSTRQGLRLSTRPWTLKMRADVVIRHAGLMRTGTFGTRVPASRRLFSAPVNILTLYSRDPARAPFLFHPSDIIQFGLTQDLRTFWSGRAFNADDIFGRSPRPGLISGWAGFTRQRVVPEQALMMRWLALNGLGSALQTPTDTDGLRATLSEQLLLANFRLFEADAAGVELAPHLLRTTVAVATVYRSADLERIARQAYERPWRRRLVIWLRKYALFLMTPYWWVVSTHLLLHELAPTMTGPARKVYRRILRSEKSA